MASLIDGAAKNGGKALARPQIARALVAAGHVASVAEAFDRYLSDDGPAYVPHQGTSPAAVAEFVAHAGGLASLAHPGQLKKDEIIPELIAAGLGAIEAYHSSHAPDVATHYLELADRFDLAVTGGSDYHGEGTRRAEFFGVTALPQARFDALADRCAPSAR
jgi:predicted metal-dependent phosphoesterase TrpH